MPSCRVPEKQLVVARLASDVTGLCDCFVFVCCVSSQSLLWFDFQAELSMDLLALRGGSTLNSLEGLLLGLGSAYSLVTRIIAYLATRFDRSEWGTDKEQDRN